MATDSAIFRKPRDYKTVRVSTDDTNKMAVIANPITDKVPFLAMVEIFEPGGSTPPNTHAEAFEFFFVLSGRGVGWCDGQRVELAPGDSLVVRPGQEHVIENPNPERLYCLTFMSPVDDFAALLQKGLPDRLDGIDFQTLERTSA